MRTSAVPSYYPLRICTEHPFATESSGLLEVVAVDPLAVERDCPPHAAAATADIHLHLAEVSWGTGR